MRAARPGSRAPPPDGATRGPAGPRAKPSWHAYLRAGPAPVTRTRAHGCPKCLGGLAPAANSILACGSRRQAPIRHKSQPAQAVSAARLARPWHDNLVTSWRCRPKRAPIWILASQRNATGQQPVAAPVRQCATNTKSPGPPSQQVVELSRRQTESRCPDAQPIHLGQWLGNAHKLAEY